MCLWKSSYLINSKAEFKEAIGIEFQGNIPLRAKLKVNESEFFVSRIYID